MVEWWQETRNKSIAEVIETSNAAAEETNDSEEEPEIVTDEDEHRKITTSEVLKKLDEVKNVIEVNGSDHLNMIFNEVIENLEVLEGSVNLKIYFFIFKSTSSFSEIS